jgi:asparagine synthase (glutamine-hydrolysing)
LPNQTASLALRRTYARLMGEIPPTWEYLRRVMRASGGFTASHELYSLMSLSRRRFYSDSMMAALQDHIPYESFEANVERIRRWHPLNRSLYWGARILLPGNLLSLKGDRVAMHSSVETRYPFLDEEVYSFLSRLHPRWKLRGFREKYLLRKLGERWLPKSIAWGPKGMFRAPFDSFFIQHAPAYVDQLLSEESLAKTGYFNPQALRHWREHFRTLRAGSFLRTTAEMGLVAVVATQLWHHTYIDASLCDLPDWRTVAGQQQQHLRASA